MRMDRIFFGIIAASLVGTIYVVQADEDGSLVCGDSKITVSPARMLGGEHALQDFLINVVQPNRTEIFKYSPSNDFLAMRCEKHKNGDPLLLINHTCSGNACADSNFSIINLRTFKTLLHANARWKGNHNIAESIIGKKIKPFSWTQEKYRYSAKFESLAGANTQTLSESEGLERLRQIIEMDALYAKWTKMECLHFWTEEKAATYFDFAIREKHRAGCPGDPNTEPIVDRFRIMRTTKKLLWYNVVEGEYIPYDRRKIVRK